MQMQDRVGQQLGNYRLIQLLGKGGFARVYLGEHIFLQSKAAIKVLNETELSPEDRQGFITEARTIAKLNHPHIVRVLDFGIEISPRIDGSTPYLVMEYILNGTLRARHPRNTIVPPQQIVSYVSQIADALQYAHNLEIVHRDVKPENMLVAAGNDILLSDFGIAVTGHDSKNPPVIKDGVVQGTVAYIAPERFQGNTHRASDQYSLGIIVYEWLSGTRPFEGTQQQIISQHISAPPPPLYGAYPHISKEVGSVMMRVLAKDPKQRYPSVKEFAQALDIALRPAYSSSPKQVYQAAYQSQPPQAYKGDAGAQQPQRLWQQVDSDEQAHTPPGQPQRLWQQVDTDGQARTPAAQAQASDEDEHTQGRQGKATPNVQPQTPLQQTPAGQAQQVTPPGGQQPSGRQQQANAPGQQQPPEQRQQANAAGPQHVPPSGQSWQTPPPGQQAQGQRQQGSFFGQQQAYQGQGWQPPPTPFQVPQQGPLHLNANPWGGGHQQARNPFFEDTSRATVNLNTGPSQAPSVTPHLPGEDGFEDFKALFSFPARALGRWFELDSEFARIQKNRSFRNLGMLLNVLSAILVGVLQRPASGWVIFVALLYSLGFFNLCIRLVNTKLAMIAGLLVAVYWGFAGIVLWNGLYLYGPYIPKLSAFFITFLPPELVALSFFCASAYLHIRYVLNRLP